VLAVGSYPRPPHFNESISRIHGLVLAPLSDRLAIRTTHLPSSTRTLVDDDNDDAVVWSLLLALLRFVDVVVIDDDVVAIIVDVVVFFVLVVGCCSCTCTPYHCCYHCQRWYLNRLWCVCCRLVLLFCVFDAAALKIPLP
jgi:hypothetical protein